MDDAAIMQVQHALCDAQGQFQKQALASKHTRCIEAIEQKIGRKEINVQFKKQRDTVRLSHAKKIKVTKAAQSTLSACK